MDSFANFSEGFVSFVWGYGASFLGGIPLLVVFLLLLEALGEHNRALLHHVLLDHPQDVHLLERLAGEVEGQVLRVDDAGGEVQPFRHQLVAVVPGVGHPGTHEVLLHLVAEDLLHEPRQGPDFGLELLDLLLVVLVLDVRMHVHAELLLEAPR